jgi:signal transduction histidine kinase
MRTQVRLLLAVFLVYALAAAAIFIWRDRTDEALADSYRAGMEAARTGQAAEELSGRLQVLVARHVAVRRAALGAFFGLFLLSLATIALSYAYLDRTLIRPIVRLGSLAMTWVPGKSWPDASAEDSHDVQNLYVALRFLMDRLSAELKKANSLAELKGELVSTISHESNNALSVISGILALLRESDENVTGKRREFYNTVEISVRSLSLQTTTLLNMGRLESGKLALRFRCVAIRALIGDCLERLKILYERKGQQIVLDFPEEGLPVRADPEALSLVLTNLLSNAVKYTPAKGRITLRGTADPADPTRALISISDTGIGISPEDQKRIFSGFYRTEASRAAAKGFGVGLPLARKILEAHYSELSVESVPGQGSTFRFALRLCQEQDGKPA